MNDKPIANLSASVRQRLSNNARSTGRPFQEVLQYFAMERFLYRLSKSPHSDKFILKGALMFVVWRSLTTRPTKDIDLLGRMNNSVDAVLPVIRDFCNQEVEPDGLFFDASSIDGRVIKEDADYAGVRVVFQCFLQNARMQMQIDIGFGDVTVPDPKLTDYPVILEMPSPRLYGYNRETVVAEKFQAMVMLGIANSRMKDFFDLWTLANEFEFAGLPLSQAISATFERRQTPLPTLTPTALRPEFGEDRAKVTQWTAFLRKNKLTNAPANLRDVTSQLEPFLMPPTRAIAAELRFDREWPQGGPWR